MKRPTLLVLGHVTRDVFGSETRLGGAASFAARAAALLGVETALVTVAPEDAPELASLRATPRLQLAAAHDAVITTFEIDESVSPRQLSLRARARSLALADVPPAWRTPDVLYVGPVANECDATLVEAFPGAYVIAAVQGWLRATMPGQVVTPLLRRAARHPPSNLGAVCLSVHDHPEAPMLAARFADQGAAVALTRGRQGASLRWGNQNVTVPAAPAHELDPTGAGDVYALVFGLALWRGQPPPQAARHAAFAAARVVEGPGLGRLAAVAQELAL